MTRRTRFPSTPILLVAAALILPGPASASLFGTLFAGSPPETLGARDGKLASCPATPNCVSSEGPGGEHAIAPLAVHGDPASAIAMLADAVRALPGANIVTLKPDYLHAEFASGVFGFVDDVELRLDAKAGVIHLRSAARLGTRDFGVNRERAEAIRAAYRARKP